MDQEEAKPSPSQCLQPVLGITLDIVSKSVAAFAIVLYGCGFLIMSIHQFSYGFTELSPLRPRIASARGATALPAEATPGSWRAAEEHPTGLDMPTSRRIHWSTICRPRPAGVAGRNAAGLNGRISQVILSIPSPGGSARMPFVNYF